MPEAALRTSPSTHTAAALIRDARRRAGLTQVQLAARAGVTQSVISTYENGRREPSLAGLQRLVLAAGFQAEIDLQPVSTRESLRTHVERHRRQLRALVAANGGSAPRLFGSVARGEDGPDSDVDIMVDLTPGSGMFALMRMQDDAERVLGVRVDVVAAAGLPDEVVAAAVPL
jgi:predicted nucleotidyltransferase/DNA-binding XRE family transcriptional regulator